VDTRNAWTDEGYAGTKAPSSPASPDSARGEGITGKFYSLLARLNILHFHHRDLSLRIEVDSLNTLAMHFSAR
jgi:hypothetical protein